MKNIRLFLLALGLLYVAQLSAQGFRRSYSVGVSAKPQAVINTADGGYLFYLSAGTSANKCFLMKTGPDGDTVWIRTYPLFVSDNSPGANLYLMPNGNYSLVIFPGSSATTTVASFSATGDLLHSRSFLGTCRTSPSDNSLFLVQPNWDTTYNVMRLNATDWSTIWEKKVKPAPVAVQLDKSMLDMTSTQDGGFCLLTNFDSSAQFPKTSRLIKFDAGGNIEWERGFGLPEYIYAGNLEQAPNGDFIFENSTGKPSAGSFVLRTDSLGNLIWSRQVLHSISAICLTPDGGVALTGNDQGWPIFQWILYKLSANGDALFSKKLIPNIASTGYSIVSTPDGGLISGASGNGGKVILAKTDADGNLYDAFVRGKAFYDRNHDCAQSPFDGTIPNWLVTATVGSVTESIRTDTAGFYEINIPTGACVLQIHPPGPVWAPCDSGVYAFITAANDTVFRDFAVKDSALCALMEVSVGTNRIRSCREATYQVAWCNQGTVTADDVFIAIILPQEMEYVSASIPVTQQGDTLWAAIGDVGYLECDVFQLTILVDCDSTQLGQTLCVKAQIFPDTLCVRPSNWSGARVVADARCVGDTLVEFILKNVGNAPTNTLDYIITEDHVVLLNGEYHLNVGEERVMERLANGTTQRIQAEQEPGYPFQSLPSAALEGCGGWNSLGLINQYPLDDADPFTDIDCLEITGAYDPNDKQGFPTGYAAEHWIEPETELTYLIRFQNTGTDTAFYVEVRDTLSPWLDPATVQAGAASHHFSWNLRHDNTLSFRFDNILLPDSNVNEAASHGFIQFRVRPKTDAPLGTVIENSASIYFDFNAPVLTNTTTHRLGRDFYTVSILDLPGSQAIPVRVYPNPFREQTRLLLPPDAAGKYRFRLYDTMTRLLRSTEFSGNEMLLEARGLTEGCYWFELSDENGRTVAQGKVVRQ